MKNHLFPNGGARWLACGLALGALCGVGLPASAATHVLDRSRLAAQHTGADAAWYVANIPFFECSDRDLEAVYYYRWSVYKAHIRQIGPPYGYLITEFIDEVGWDRKPYNSINAAAGHHIYDGRWLKDKRYLDGYIDYLGRGGGNDHTYSENIADAAFARYLVNGDAAFLKSQWGVMRQQYELWQDHYDAARGLYYIPPGNDATEFSIASLEMGNGKGEGGGAAFRPTINSYMYANARALSKMATLAGDTAASQLYAQRAEQIKGNVRQWLWNPALGHYTDRYQKGNEFVRAWDLIPGRELAGFVPWQFGVPEDDTAHRAAWSHLLDPQKLSGPYGLRTVEPSYAYYMRPYRYKAGETAECQWNGPSWPYQTAQVLSGLARFLQSYSPGSVRTEDYVKLLRQYARQHRLPDGQLDLQEDYDADTGQVLVGLDRSHHYNHSTFLDLIISGLCGVQPAEGEVLKIHPLVDASIRYFCLDGVAYHGHELTVVYDADGGRYHMGKGLTVWVDGKKVARNKPLAPCQVKVGKTKLPAPDSSAMMPANGALNLVHKGFPAPSASVNTNTMFQAIDGRAWYFALPANRWTTQGSTADSDWYALDFGQPWTVSCVKLHFYADGQTFAAPADYAVERWDQGRWVVVPLVRRVPVQPLAGTVNTVEFSPILTTQLRVQFKRSALPLALAEIECH